MKKFIVFTFFLSVFLIGCGQTANPGSFQVSGKGVTISVKMKPEKESLAKTYKAALKPAVK